MAIRKILKVIHLWLGLGSGVIVFIIAITGCLYAFQEEIQNVIQPYRFVEKSNQDFLLPSALVKIAKDLLPNKKLHSIKYHFSNKSAEAIFYNYQPTYYYILYINPYDGKILHTQNMEEGFFPFILKGHFYLWLPEPIGQKVVAISTIIFIGIFLTGIMLWIPKNWNILKQRIWFRWKKTTSWKRKNFDIHAIMGGYVFLIALLFCMTGLVWGFQWFADTYHKVMGGEKTLMYQEPISTSAPISSQVPAIDDLYKKIAQESPLTHVIEIHPPEEKTSTIAINTNTDESTYWKIDYRYFDQYSEQEVPSNNIYSRFHNANLADKMLRMNYDLHTGAVWGIWGKIFMFVMSLLIASLPITGFLFWYGRTKKLKSGHPK